MMSFTAQSLVADSLQLVSPLTSYSQLSQLINDPKSSTEQFSQVINSDPALAIRLLKVVNSSFYGFPSQINTISRAITIIGTRELSHLVLATSVINSFTGIPAELINIATFWRHSIACAMVAKQLAIVCQQPDVEHFFIAGLLHNIGALVIYQSAPDLAMQAIETAQNGEKILFEAEQDIIGFDHSEVGLALIKAWKLPASLENMVRYHHQPSLADNASIEVAIIHLADIMTSAAGLGHSGTHHVAPLDQHAWDLLSLDETILPPLLQQVAEQIDDFATQIMSS